MNKEAKQEWRSADDAARITDEGASSERLQAHVTWSLCGDGKKAVEVEELTKEEGAVVSTPGNEGRIARPSLGECQKWVASLCWVHLGLGSMDNEK